MSSLVSLACLHAAKTRQLGRQLYCRPRGKAGMAVQLPSQRVSSLVSPACLHAAKTHGKRPAAPIPQAGRIGYNRFFGPSGCRLDRLIERVFSMAKSKKKAEVVFLVCKETGDYNYTLRRKPGGEKLSIKKYCPRLRKHTEHAEKKK